MQNSARSFVNSSDMEGYCYNYRTCVLSRHVLLLLHYLTFLLQATSASRKLHFFAMDVAAGSPQRHKAWPKKQKGKNREERRGAEKM